MTETKAAGKAKREMAWLYLPDRLRIDDADDRIRTLDLFAGVGGSLLAGSRLGWRCVCAVECDPYRQAVLLARQADGSVDPFAIWDDAESFYGARWRGAVDAIFAGFPCTPWSAAGRRRGAKDARNLWPATARIIAGVAPRLVYLENVPRIRPYLPVVRSRLQRLGYCVPPSALAAAASVGAGHLRWRRWIPAYRYEG